MKTGDADHVTESKACFSMRKTRREAGEFRIFNAASSTVRSEFETVIYNRCLKLVQITLPTTISLAKAMRSLL